MPPAAPRRRRSSASSMPWSSTSSRPARKPPRDPPHPMIPLTLPSPPAGERMKVRGAIIFALLLILAAPLAAASQAPYQGPLIDAHSHLPSPHLLEAYVAAMKRHNVGKVVLLGVGGVQKQDVEWIPAAAQPPPPPHTHNEPRPPPPPPTPT